MRGMSRTVHKSPVLRRNEKNIDGYIILLIIKVDFSHNHLLEQNRIVLYWKVTHFSIIYIYDSLLIINIINIIYV